MSTSVFLILKFSTCCRNTNLDYTIQTKSYYFTIMCCKLRKWPNTVRAGTTTLFVVPAARLHRLAESIPLNRFLASLNVYKYELSIALPFAFVQRPALIDANFLNKNKENMDT